MDIQITFNQEFYEARIKKLLDCLLQSDFLSTNPYLLNDAALNDFFKKRSEGYIHPEQYTDRIEIIIHNFCTIGEVYGHKTHEYNGHFYEKVQILFGKDKQLDIKYSQFKYLMTPILEAFVDGGFVETYGVRSSILGTNESFDKIFNNADRRPILYAYSFPAYNKYNNGTECYRLFALFNHGTDCNNVLREQLVRSQWFVLNHILKCTSLYTPGTRMYVNGVSSSYTCWPESVKFFIKIFDKDYRLLFKDRLQDITRILLDNHIIPTDDF